MKNEKSSILKMEVKGALISFLVAFIIILLIMAFGQTDFLLTMLMIPLAIHLGFVTAIIIHGFRVLINKRASDEKAPEIQRYDPIDSGTFVDGVSADQTVTERRLAKNYVYNRGKGYFSFNGGKTVTWFWVIVLLIVLYPVGVYFLIAKVAGEQDRYYKNGSVLQVAGGILSAAALGFVALAAGNINDGYFMLYISIVFLINTLTYFFIGTWLIRRGAEDNRYRTLITVRKITDIDKIAEEEKTTFAHAVNVIEKLIDSGLLGHGYVSYIDREVIVPGISKKIVKRCKNCSGTTVLYSTEPQICDYCGGAL